jgi:hypothetical protein
MNPGSRYPIAMLALMLSVTCDCQCQSVLWDTAAAK